MLFLVPIYSTCSSIANLQSIRSIQLPIMVMFSIVAYAANRAANTYISDRSDIVSASGAFVIGLCGNLYSRLIGGTAFTAMVPGVLFLVPVRTAQLTISPPPNNRRARSLPSVMVAASYNRTTTTLRNAIPAVSSWVFA